MIKELYYLDKCLVKLIVQRWNLKNLSRGLNPPKTRFKLSAGLNLETFDAI